MANVTIKSDAGVVFVAKRRGTGDEPLAALQPGQDYTIELGGADSLVVSEATESQKAFDPEAVRTADDNARKEAARGGEIRQTQTEPQTEQGGTAENMSKADKQTPRK